MRLERCAQRARRSNPRREIMNSYHSSCSAMTILMTCLVVAGCASDHEDGTDVGTDNVTGASEGNALAVVKTWVGRNPGESLVGGKNLWNQPAVQQAIRQAAGDALFAQTQEATVGPSTDVKQDASNPNRIV